MLSPQPRSVYTNELKAFLGHGDQRVLLIHGHWGTGKSYFWNTFARTHREYLENKFYSYVSLFGASSIADIKALIVLGGEPRNESNKVAIRWQHTKNWFFRKQRYFDQLKVPYFGSIGALVPKAEELLIQDFLVCFDDLERRNHRLHLEQLFGLISILKEQNRCRIVIICNEEELSPRDRGTLNKYREKVVDRQLTYNPRFDENFRLIFSTSETAIREVFERLGLNNIRVFQQTHWCVEYFESLLENRHDAFVQTFRQQCAKLAALHFQYSKEISLDTLKSIQWVLAERGELTDSTKDLVTALQFTPSEADNFIMEYLRNGYCNLEELKPVIDKLDHEHKRSEADNALRRFWNEVRDSYHNDTARVVADAKQVLYEYCAYLPFRSTATALDFVKKIEPSLEIDALKEEAARNLIPNADAATLRDILTECKSRDIRQAAEEKLASLKPSRSIGELVVALGASEGLDPSDFALLNAYSEAQLFEWTSKAQDPNILFILAQTISRGQFESTHGKEIGKKFGRIFEKLAKRSVLDGERTKIVFDRIRRMLKQRGVEAPPELCPPPEE